MSDSESTFSAGNIKNFLYHELISFLPFVGGANTGEVEKLDGNLQQIRYHVKSSKLVGIVSTSNEVKRNRKLKRLDGVRGIADRLGTSLEAPLGISREELNEGLGDRRKAFGTNVYPRPDPETFIMLVWDALQDSTLVILIVSAIVSLILGVIFPAPGEESTGWIEGAAILLAVALVSFVTAANDWNKERQFRNLSKESDRVFYDVWRGGETTRIVVGELVVGDVVILGEGDKIPADGLFVDGRGGESCRVDESVMTGETLPVLVDPEHPVMLSGTLMQEGLAHMLVIATGSRSQWGQLLANLSDDKPPTPLQTFLDELANYIGFGGLGVAGIVFIVLFVYWLYALWFGSLRMVRCAMFPTNAFNTVSWTEFCFEYSKDIVFQMSSMSAIVNMFIIAVTIVVVAVPEGLPLAVTLSLAYSMRAMMKDNNLVRHLDACETMGGATNICSDKTGTLTQNRMTVMQGWICGSRFEQVADVHISSAVVDMLAIGTAINSKARFEYPVDPVTGVLVYNGLPIMVGNKTECALLIFADKLRRAESGVFPYQEIRESCHVAKLYNFTSARKRMSTIVRHDGPHGGPYRMHSKGASEIILARCTNVQLGDGKQIVKLSDTVREEVSHQIETMARMGLRTVALAYRDFTSPEVWEHEEVSREDESPEHALTLLGVVGIEDPVRPEVPAAVHRCQSAGIFVRMVTGDNIDTASKIARDCGILTDDGIAMEGDRFRVLDERELTEILPRLQVLARSKPLDKKILVEALMKRREVVAVTGDGTNDAPALRRAHVGLSMGIAGTQVAKEASDIVILDDNFASIIKAVMWGRCVYDNIRKFLQFQLTVNFAALIIAFLGAVTNRGTPLAAVQLLWVNLIMDTMAALALGTEKPTEDLLNRKPYGLRDRFISNIMLRNVIGQGMYQVIVLCVMLYFGSMLFGWVDGGILHYTMIFNTFVWMQIFNEINSRKVNDEMNVFDNIHRNYIFMGVLLFTVVLQVLIVTFGGSAAQTTPLSIRQWVICIGLGAVALPLGFILRLIKVPVAAPIQGDFLEEEEEEQGPASSSSEEDSNEEDGSGSEGGQDKHHSPEH